MTTCPSCGNETAADATCVVCGADPTTGRPSDDAVAAAPPAAAQEQAALAPPPRAPGATAGPEAGDAAWPTAQTPPPPPSGDAIAVSESSRNWGMIAHLSALVAGGLGGLIFLGPLVVWLVRKDQDRFVAHHAVEALNFNLSVMLYGALAIIVGFTTIIGLVVAIPAAIVGFFVWFVTSIQAAVRAQRGEGYRYPLTIRLVRE